MMTRRAMLAAAALVPLAACQSTPSSVATVASDVSLIATGLSAVMPQVQGLSVAALGVVQQALADITKLSTTVAAVPTVTAAQPVVQQVASDLLVVANALSGLPLPPTVETALQAAQILIPIIEAAVSLPAPVGIAPGAMTPAQARAALQAAAGA